MGPPPTSHFHILADTPAGLQGINPPKTAQPSAARTYYDVDGKRVVDPKGQLISECLFDDLNFPKKQRKI